jgi:hypothetical protein
MSAVSVSAEYEKIALADAADFFEPNVEDALKKSMDAAAQRTGWNILILSFEGEYTEREAENLLDTVYYEKFGDTPGAGYIMTTEVGMPEGENDYAIYVKSYGGARFQSSAFLDTVEDYFLDYKEFKSAEAFLSGCVPYQNTTSTVYDLSLVRLIYPGLLFAIIPAGICIVVVIVRYKSHPKISATRYLDQNETRFYRRTDTFIREYTTRTPINRGSSGGSRGGGSGGGFSGGGRSGRR